MREEGESLEKLSAGVGSNSESSQAAKIHCPLLLYNKRNVHEASAWSSFLRKYSCSIQCCV